MPFVPMRGLAGGVKENGEWKDIPFFTSEYIKYELESNYATDKAPVDG